MKTIITLFSALCVLSGCATLGGSTMPTSAEYISTDTTSASLPDPMAPTSLMPDLTPRIIISVSGGAPVIGIPLGGGIFLPVTGGMPLVGIPIGP